VARTRCCAQAPRRELRDDRAHRVVVSGIDLSDDLEAGSVPRAGDESDEVVAGTEVQQHEPVRAPFVVAECEQVDPPGRIPDILGVIVLEPVDAVVQGDQLLGEAGDHRVEKDVVLARSDSTMDVGANQRQTRCHAIGL
jgi:hypothetical protein